MRDFITPNCTRWFSARFRRALTMMGWVAALAVAAPNAVLALSTDRDQPVNIEADWAEADDIKGVTVYKGKVVIIQGSLRISGDVVTMYFDKNKELERMIAVGKLARFRQKVDGEEVFQHAKAKRIQYNLATDTMVLTGTAKLSKGEDSIQANRIVYDTLNGRIKGEGRTTTQIAKSKDAPKTTRERVRIVLKPKKDCPDGTRRATCPK